MDFGTRIASARNDATASMQRANQAQQKADNAQNDFQTALNNREGFGSIYDRANQKFMDTNEYRSAKSNFENARNAVNSLNTQMNEMPESVRAQYAGTGMTESQRQRILQYRMNDMRDTYDMQNKNYMAASQDYNMLADRAMKQAMYQATGENDNQWKNIDARQNLFAQLLGAAQNAFSLNQKDRGMLADVYGARDSWENAERNRALERWKQQQENDRNNARIAAQNNAARLQYLGNKEAAASQLQAQKELAQAQNEAKWEAARQQNNREYNAKIDNHDYYWGDLGRNLIEAPKAWFNFLTGRR